MPAYHSFNEAQTCYGFIDPQLTKRGRSLRDRRSVSLDVPVDGYDAFPVNEITDFLGYVLKLEEVTHFLKGGQNGLAFIAEHTYNAGQTRFLRRIQTVMIQKRPIEANDLSEPPFYQFWINATEKLFSERRMRYWN